MRVNDLKLFPRNQFAKLPPGQVVGARPRGVANGVYGRTFRLDLVGNDPFLLEKSGMHVELITIDSTTDVG